jgi:hypothetical protein
MKDEKHWRDRPRQSFALRHIDENGARTIAVVIKHRPERRQEWVAGKVMAA